MRKQFAILLFLLLPLVLPAQTPVEGDVACGSRVQVTATAAPGYHFTEWSDGVTDNPRWLDVYSDSGIVAYFEKDCVRPEVPVVPLYDYILTIDKATINEHGFFPSEKDIQWYRVKGDLDAIGAVQRDDELVHVGYSLTVAQAGNKTDAWYYVEVAVNAPDSLMLCSDTLRSTTWRFDGTQAIVNTSQADYTCFFTGTELCITGLPVGEASEVALYDMTGRRLIYQHVREDKCFLSPPPPGSYMIVITTRAGTTGLRYLHH